MSSWHDHYQWTTFPPPQYQNSWMRPSQTNSLVLSNARSLPVSMLEGCPWDFLDGGHQAVTRFYTDYSIRLYRLWCRVSFIESDYMSRAFQGNPPSFSSSQWCLIPPLPIRQSFATGPIPSIRFSPTRGISKRGLGLMHLYSINTIIYGVSIQRDNTAIITVNHLRSPHYHILALVTEYPLW